MAPSDVYERVMEIAGRRGFFWPSFEIYGGLSGFYTYGDLGTKLKRNIERVWREFFVRRHGFLEVETPIINASRVFEASGHLDHFKEYMVQCARCGQFFRADHVIEEEMGLENVEAMGLEGLKRLLREGDIRCPECGGELKEPVMFLTMFQTTIGATGGEVGYARPEAAQGMFLNFRRGFQHAREKLPFALAQAGKVLRNEISPRRGLLRLREFTIMEVELFFDPAAVLPLLRRGLRRGDHAADGGDGGEGREEAGGVDPQGGRRRGAHHDGVAGVFHGRLQEVHLLHRRPARPPAIQGP
ncbi:MAG: glycine--tRNA ligase, partial [Candidatus Bathyarchaeia archaeon]